MLALGRNIERCKTSCKRFLKGDRRMRAHVSSSFKRFLISYLIILLIPNLAGYLSYRTSIDVAESSSIENSTMLLRQSAEILERKLAEVEGFTKQLAINQDLNLLINEKRQGDAYNVFGFWKTMRDLSGYSQTNDFLQSFYIYFQNYNVILTPGSIYYRPEHYYELNHYVDEPYETWKETILQATHERTLLPARPFMQDKNASSMLTFVQSLPLNSFGNPKATAVVLIDERKISSLLESLTSQYGGWAIITDSSGKPLASQGLTKANSQAWQLSMSEARTTRKLDDGTLLITVRSDKTGWMYAAGVPKEALMGKANTIKYMTWTLSAAALLISLIIGMLLSYRNSVPINRLMNVFKEQVGLDTSRIRNEYDFLSGNISDLIANNKQLQTELSLQMPLVKDAFIKRLLAGEFNSAKELEAVRSQADVVFLQPYGFVGMLKINGYGGIDSKEIIEELSAARLIVKQMLHELEAGLHATDLGSDKIVMLLTPECEPDKDWQRAFEARFVPCMESMYVNYRISITSVMGGVYASLSDISRSYSEASQAMDYAVHMEEKRLVWYEETMRESMLYYYPMDTEQRLMNTVKAGEASEGKRIVAEIVAWNFAERELSIEMKEQLIGEMKGTLLRLLDQKAFQDGDFSREIQERIAALRLSDGMEQVRQSMECMVDDFCAVIAKKKNELQHEMLQDMMKYIQEYYQDPELTIYRIAEHVGRPEKYISQLFKERMGESLSDYLESMRISKAADLLTGNGLTIDEIASQVGYNSAHSFRRAFKRVRGVSPSLYRQSAN
ncbi:AraC family transcriptional regulator [Paenibacillus rigui]|uniref:AraC family transcriptional regulator n=2 Tax=Paenibacillus rigui TaxID=554312 RepID=A0A229UQS9_9BACL|nr:AraC family transcriptional regulator [Paenibacillus rigui]